MGAKNVYLQACAAMRPAVLRCETGRSAAWRGLFRRARRPVSRVSASVARKWLAASGVGLAALVQARLLKILYFRLPARMAAWRRPHDGARSGVMVKVWFYVFMAFGLKYSSFDFKLQY